MLPRLQGRRAPNGRTELLKVNGTAAVQCLSVVGVYIVIKSDLGQNDPPNGIRGKLI